MLLGDAAWCVTLFAGYGSAPAVGGADYLGCREGGGHVRQVDSLEHA